MDRMKRRQFSLALVLACLMALSPLTAGFAALAEGSFGTISDFDALPDGLTSIQAGVGTELVDLGLPDALTATVDGEPAEVEVSSWRSAPEFDSNAPGSYVLTPRFDTSLYAVDPDAALPAIRLSLIGAEPEQTEDQDEPDDTEPADEAESEPAQQETEPEQDQATETEPEREPEDEPESEPVQQDVLSAFQPLEEAVALRTVALGTPVEALELPVKLVAVINGDTLRVGVRTWRSEPEYDGNTAGTYAFTPRLDADTLSVEAERPVIRVTVKEPEPEQPSEPESEPEGEPASDPATEPEDEQEIIPAEPGQDPERAMIPADPGQAPEQAPIPEELPQEVIPTETELPAAEDFAFIVTDIAPLDGQVAAQEADVGTPQDALDLPTALTATLDDNSQAQLDVNWVSDEPYDANQPAIYHFKAQLAGDYQLSEGTSLPDIEVNLKATVQVIVAFDPPLGADTDTRYVAFGTPEAQIGLPTQLTASLTGGETRPVNVTWRCETTYNAQLADRYTFTAALVDVAEYMLASGVAMPQVIVEVQGQQGLSVADPTPAQSRVSVGETASFSVTASGGAAPYSYQWTRYPSATDARDQLNGAPVGENSNVLSFTADIGHNGSYYRCLVTDANALSATSGAAGLTVFAPKLADPALNEVSIPNERLYVNRSFTIRASGDRQDEQGIYRGDTRYVPVSWRSDDERGSFGASGHEARVRLNSAGERTLTVKFAEQVYAENGWRDTGKEDEKSVTVTLRRVYVTGITLSRHELYLDEGDRVKLNHTVKPEDATDKRVRFYSDDEDVATVSRDGYVTAWAPGEAVITVVSREDEDVFDSCLVSVAEVDDLFEDDEDEYDDDDNGIPQTSDPALPMWLLATVFGAAMVALIGLLIYYRKRK